MTGFTSSRVAGLLLAAAFTALAVSPATALTNEEIAMLSGPDREKVLIEGAKKEGTVIWYSTMNGDIVTQPLEDAFLKKYPFLKISSIRTGSAEITAKATAERDAGRVTVDVMAASASDSLDGMNIAIPFVSPKGKELPDGSVPANNMYVSFRNAVNINAWNTKLMPTKDAPKTWEELADPKYKGKMVWSDSPASGAPRLISHFRAMWGEEKALEFLKKLQKQDIRTVPGNAGAVMAQLQAGEFPIIIGFSGTVVADAKKDGAPVDGVNPEPSLSRASAIALMKNAPHPHAAMLLIDFLLDKDGGQKILGEVGYFPMHPAVKTTKDLAFIDPNTLGIKPLLLDTKVENEMNKKPTELYTSMFR